MGVTFGKLKKNLALEMDFWCRAARTSIRERVRSEVMRENGYKK
jgi:hypothetical protein